MAETSLGPMTTLIAALSLAGTPVQSYTWKDIAQTGLKDITFTAVGVKSDRRELRKINDDFAQSYQFDSVKMFGKEPFMIRGEAQVDDTKLLYIMNGSRKYYKIGRAPGIPIDVSNAPGKRQTVFDFGVITPSLFQDLMVANFVRVDRETGALIFDVTYNKKFDDTSRHRIWVDKEKRYVEKRVWYNQEGKQLATFSYEAPKQLSGVWFASKVTVRNNENKVAGVTEYRNVKMNGGLEDSLFKF